MRDSEGFKLVNDNGASSYLSVTSDGCVDLGCDDGFYSGKLSREDSLQLSADCQRVGVEREVLVEVECAICHEQGQCRITFSKEQGVTFKSPAHWW